MDHAESGNEYVSEITSELSALLQIDESKPSKILGTLDPDSKWKKGWFTSVSGRIELLLDFVQDNNLKKEMERMTTFWTSNKFAGDTPHTTQKNIDEANALIKKILSYFRK